MKIALIFLLGIVFGALVAYFFMRKRKTVSIATYVQNQQSEKQGRKEKILAMIREKGSTTNNEVEKLLGVSDASATNYLQELEREGTIEQVGERGRFVSYRSKL
ncbi:MAG: DUF977 family protein [Patescibacteria group bacterium]